MNLHLPPSCYRCRCVLFFIIKELLKILSSNNFFCYCTFIMLLFVIIIIIIIIITFVDVLFLLSKVSYPSNFFFIIIHL